MNKAKGFSILEVLVVLSVMGLMAGLLLPAIQMVNERGERALSEQKLRQLGIAMSDGNGIRWRRVEDRLEWLKAIVTQTGINERGFFLFPEDQRSAGLEGTLEQPVLDLDGNWIWDEDEIVLSYSVVGNLDQYERRSSLPVLWTRGLRKDGLWESDAQSLYGDRGGFILFADGRVKFYRDLGVAGGQLRDFKTGRPTNNIFEALPSGVKVINGID